MGNFNHPGLNLSDKNAPRDFVNIQTIINHQSTINNQQLTMIAFQ